MRLILATSMLLAAAGFGGCASESSVMVADTADADVALGMVATAPDFQDDLDFRLGAGDDLGRDVFSIYVASMDVETFFYATGADDRPISE